jgi:hypothetical protein
MKFRPIGDHAGDVTRGKRAIETADRENRFNYDSPMKSL